MWLESQTRFNGDDRVAMPPWALPRRLLIARDSARLELALNRRQRWRGGLVLSCVHLVVRPHWMFSLLQSSSRSCRASRSWVTAKPCLRQHRYISSTPHRRAEVPETSASTPTDPKGKGIDNTQASDKPKPDSADAPLPLLQRPLGLRDKPKARVQTWEDTKEKFLDQDKRLEERTHLYVLTCYDVDRHHLTTTQRRAREATRGYFTDLNATRKHGGKTWIAPKVMIREDVSRTSVKQKQNRWAVVLSLLCTRVCC